jgi:hypothetical protein
VFGSTKQLSKAVAFFAIDENSRKVAQWTHTICLGAPLQDDHHLEDLMALLLHAHQLRSLSSEHSRVTYSALAIAAMKAPLTLTSLNVLIQDNIVTSVSKMMEMPKLERISIHIGKKMDGNTEPWTPQGWSWTAPRLKQLCIVTARASRGASDLVLRLLGRSSFASIHELRLHLADKAASPAALGGLETFFATHGNLERISLKVDGLERSSAVFEQIVPLVRSPHMSVNLPTDGFILLHLIRPEVECLTLEMGRHASREVSSYLEIIALMASEGLEEFCVRHIQLVLPGPEKTFSWSAGLTSTDHAYALLVGRLVRHYIELEKLGISVVDQQSNSLRLAQVAPYSLRA